MRLMLMFVICVTFAAQVLAQAGATISGVVTVDGTAVPDAPVQAKDKASGAAFRTLSAPTTGEYVLTQLPAGTYELSVRIPGFKFDPFLRSDVVVAPRQSLRADIGLKIGNLDTIADDPFTYLADIRKKAAALTGPVPRTAGGRPDLSGVWNGNDDLYPEDPALLQWAAAVVQKRLQDDLKDLPRGQCLPAGVLPTGPFFRKFVQTPELLVVLSEDDVLGFRQVFLDGRAHPAEPSPTWLGHAVGRWEGTHWWSTWSDSTNRR